jgi:hypothetical protein
MKHYIHVHFNNTYSDRRICERLKQLRRDSTSDITYWNLPLLNPKVLYRALSYYLVDGSRMRQIDTAYRFKLYIT